LIDRNPKSNQMQIQNSDGLEKIMAASGHLLVTGGPGSGKTTASILKAAQIAEHDLHPGQRVLFLSFARATVSRVIEAIEYEHKIPPEQKRRIDVETYHSFFWRILKTHGYLLGLPRRLAVLTPPNEAVILSAIRREYAAESALSLHSARDVSASISLLALLARSFTVVPVSVSSLQLCIQPLSSTSSRTLTLNNG
jgi:DNA helicase-2/ATP-dependent DNA helicase PcrA